MIKRYGIINKYKDCECQCDLCKRHCSNRVCWPLPEEAKNLIDKGYSDRLMLEHYTEDDNSRLYVLVPAIDGYEGDGAPFNPMGACTFFSSGLCELHDLGLKPFEGRISYHGYYSYKSKLHETVVKTWRTPSARKLAADWRKKHDVDIEEPGAFEALDFMMGMMDPPSRDRSLLF